MLSSSVSGAMVMMAAAALSLSSSSSSSSQLAAAEVVPLQQPEAYQQRLVDWIRSGKNGFFHPQVQWKRLGTDGTGPYAMHAMVDMPKGTKLLVVPRSHIIDSFKTHEECVTIARMLDEYQKGDDSFFAPYLSYLFDKTSGGTTTGLLPCSWSDEGKDLFDFILGTDNEDIPEQLRPLHFVKHSVFDVCGDSFRAEYKGVELEDEDLRQQAEDAYLFYISRSWTDKMVPVLDMYNHRNGASLNVESTTAHDTSADVTAFAIRDIKAGEQLQNTYSECMDKDCEFGGIKYEYTTAEIFVDYGFLELYPRRWPLDDLIAEVDEDLVTGEKSFQWIFETPSEETAQWMESHLSRLRSIEADVRESISEHKSHKGAKHQDIDHEAYSLLELFEGYVEVLELGLKHKNDDPGVTEVQFTEELRERRRRARELDPIDEL